MSFPSYEALRSSKNTFSIYESTFQVFPLRIHPQMECMYIKKGTAKISILDTEYDLTAGDVAVILPNHPHAYISCKNCQVLIMFFSPDMVHSFVELTAHKTLSTPILYSSEVTNQIRTIMKGLLALSPEEQNPCLIKGGLYTILGKFLHRTPLVPYDTRKLDAITKVLIRIEETYTSNVLLKDIAYDTGFNPNYLSHIFKSAVGCSYNDYVNSLRTDLARELLTRDLTVMQVSLECGFDNIRSFNRIFKKFTSLTPSQYRRQITAQRD